MTRAQFTPDLIEVVVREFKAGTVIKGIPPVVQAECGVTLTDRQINHWIRQNRTAYRLPRRKRQGITPVRENTVGSYSSAEVEMMTALWNKGVRSALIAKKLNATFGTTRTDLQINDWAGENRLAYNLKMRSGGRHGEAVVSVAPVAGLEEDDARSPSLSLTRAAPLTALPSGPATVVASGPVALEALRRDSCRWMLNTPPAEAVFCGEAIHRGSFCEAHSALAYLPRKPKPPGRPRRDSAHAPDFF